MVPVDDLEFPFSSLLARYALWIWYASNFMHFKGEPCRADVVDVDSIVVSYYTM